MLQTVGARLRRVFKKRRRTEGLRAAVAISEREIAVALVRKLDGQRPKVLRIVVEEAPLGFADPVLKKIISEFDLRRIPVSAVINPADYQIAQVQAPDVPLNERRAAARYSMRDAFDFPIETATLDIFDLPEQTSRGDKKLCFAIASRGDALAEHDGQRSNGSSASSTSSTFPNSASAISRRCCRRTPRAWPS